MKEQNYKWDYFIAHSSADKSVALKLYNLLSPQSRVFLDSQNLRPGDDWDQELASAQRESRITVVLISSRVEGAYYQREEIAAAIGMARADKTKHRVVPVYLGQSARSDNIPYGLRLKHEISVPNENELTALAKSLLALIGDNGDSIFTHNRNRYFRVIIPVFGFLMILAVIIGIVKNLPQSGTNPIEPSELKKWEGEWKISWEGDNQISYEEEPLKSPLRFDTQNGSLVGYYEFTLRNNVIKGVLQDIQVGQNHLKGKYEERGDGLQQSGEIEFLLFPDGNAFIGRYRRIQSNFLPVDANYKIWLGKRK